MKFLLMVSLLALGLAGGCGHKQATAETVASLEELNRALSVVAMRGGAFPPSSNDLAAFLSISGKTMPVPPAGKKLVIAPGTRQFVLVDQ